MSAAQEKEKAAPAQEGLIEFAAFPPAALDYYIAKNELAPNYPPSSSTSTNPTSNPSSSRSKPKPHTTANTNRSSEDNVASIPTSNTDSKGTPTHFFDHEAANSYLGAVADRHCFAQPAPKEGEVVVGFLYRCKAKDSCLRIAQP